MRSRHQSLGLTILGYQSLGLLGLALGMSTARSLSFKSLPGGECLGVYGSHSFWSVRASFFLEVKTQILNAKPEKIEEFWSLGSMDLWCSVLKVHRCLGFKPHTFSGFMTRSFCASKFTDFFSCVCAPTLRTTVGLPQLWPTVDLPFAQSKFSSIKFCNTCCRLLKKTGNKITAQKKMRSGEPDAKENQETCFE